MLSLSDWRDEKALVHWRTAMRHHEVQGRGRREILQDYHLRVGQVTADTQKPAGYFLEEHRLDETEVGVLLMLVFREGAAADHLSDTVLLKESARLRQVRVIRDCGMFDRREAPQFSLNRSAADGDDPRRQGCVRSSNGMPVPILAGNHLQLHATRNPDHSHNVRQGEARQGTSNNMDRAEPRRATILLVEDEPMLAEAFRRVLVSAGLDVRVCRSAMDALRLLQAGETLVDVVLSDVQLPAMSGERLAGEIRRARPGLPVLLMTGFSATVTEENSHLLGVVGVLQKPVPPGLLVAAVRNAMFGTTKEVSCFSA